MTVKSKFVFQTASPVREQIVQNVVLVPQNPLEQIVVHIFSLSVFSQKSLGARLVFPTSLALCLLPHLTVKVPKTVANAFKYMGHYCGRQAAYLVGRVIVLFQVRMCQRLFHRDPLVRIKRQHLIQ